MDALGCDALWHHGLACGLCQLLSWLVTDLLHFQGLERTTRDNFGGGNTAWEEEKLAKYRDRSEAGAGVGANPFSQPLLYGGRPWGSTQPGAAVGGHLWDSRCWGRCGPDFMGSLD